MAPFLSLGQSSLRDSSFSFCPIPALKCRANITVSLRDTTLSAAIRPSRNYQTPVADIARTLSLAIRTTSGHHNRTVPNASRRDAKKNRGREGRLVSAPPPSEPDGRISRIRLSSWWVTCDRIDKLWHGPLPERTTLVR